jgi:drug/metabolite transporter (DMT)-like permease
MNAVGMVTAAALLLGGAALAGDPFALPQRPSTWVAVAYVGVVGSVVVFVVYLIVARIWSASRAAYLFVVTPVVTVFLSAWLDDEPIGSGLVAGGLLVLAGVYIGALRPGPAAPAPAAP